MADRIKKRPSRLGRGLSSLMAAPLEVSVVAAQVLEAPGNISENVPGDAPRILSGGDEEGLQYLSVGNIQPNPHQPRQKFDDDAIHHLAASIQADGLMQPIIVRPAPRPRKLSPARKSDPSLLKSQASSLKPSPPSGGGGYEIVAGERRWRAAKLAGLDRIPALIRQLDDQQSAEWALIENLQREDLNPIDRAEAFQRLVDQFGLSHDKIAERVGLNRATISNLLRLLELSDISRNWVREGLLSMGQARAIAGLSGHAAQDALAERVVREGLSVRAVEKAARQLSKAGAGTSGGGGRVSAGSASKRPAHLIDLEKQLTEQLGTKIHIHAGRRKGSGKLTIEFYSLDQFDAILSKLGAKVG